MKPFGKLMSRLDAVSIIEDKTHRTTKVEEVQLSEASGRVLAVDVVAGLNVPAPFSVS